MTRFPLLAAVHDLPAPWDSARAAAGLKDLRAAAAAADADLAGFFDAFAADPEGRRLAEAVFGNSPFLAQSLVQSPGQLRALAEQGLDSTFAEIVSAVEGAWRQAADTKALMTALRKARVHAALVAAVADIGAMWPLERVTAALSEFADAVLTSAVRFLLARAAAEGRIELADSADPAEKSGFTVFAVGKLGSSELNYSSDVDLLVLWDAERVRCTAGTTPEPVFVNLTRELVRILEERSAAGYVFRTDLRLRPDPGATPVALSLAAAETYYESVGQNWERAALIRARTVAGDREVGERFLRFLMPFLWRKHLDFAAIADIHSIKRQIRSHRGHGKVQIRGHNIKLGAGGIREIEFFAQTQQLIAGGRDPRLRVADTCGAIRVLADTGRVDDATARDLIDAYRFLRRVEHRLQMIADEQTHTVPEDEAGFSHVATFLGYTAPQDFEAELRGHLERVTGHYAQLFEHAPPLTQAGNLVFTGGEDDPETQDTLRHLGFAAPERISATVRGWHHGRFRATRSPRARGLLTEIIPAILAAFGRTPHPDAALMHFDEFLSGLPAGVQLFSLFHAHPELLDLVAEIMGTAPSLAEALQRSPTLLDAVLGKAFFEPLPGRAGLAEDLEETLARARDYEDVLDMARRWANDRRFQAGVQIMRGQADARASGAMLANLADALIATLLPRVIEDFAATAGRVPGASFAVLALGKLGAREMTARSDLDLVFVYEAPDGASDGPKVLSAGEYFARLSQRLIAAFTAPTAEGRLFEVDMRLRPSGMAGPVASTLEGFLRYQRETAWTWEHMALTRARVVAATGEFAGRVDKDIRALLTAPRDPDALVRDVVDMRARIERHHGTGDPWQVKHVRGGLVDLEFLAQSLLLRHAVDHPGVLTGDTAATFANLAAAGLLEGSTAGGLVDATLLLRNVQAFLRQCSEGAFDEGAAPYGLKAALARACGKESFPELKAALAGAEAGVYEAYQALLADADAGLGKVSQDV